MFITLKKWTVVYVLCLILMAFGFAVILQQGAAIQTSQSLIMHETKPTLIIDPGHGGEDGGAIARDGTIESHINLSIALKAAELARLLNWDICMTRSEDISIYDEDAKTLRQKKVSDLKNRVALCDSVDNGVLISFHQNSLPGSPSVRGAQVFYNEIEGSAELAIVVQEMLNMELNGSHPKAIKPIGDSSYLMKNAQCPAILIECAFLSNAEEVSLLKTNAYQTKLAVAIITAVTDHLSSTPK